MKLFSILIISSLALPLSVSAETWYLVIGARNGYSSGSIASVPMTTEEECNEAGEKLYTSKTKPNDIHGTFQHIRYVCLKGK